MMRLFAYLRLARPLDWLKNGFVLLGLLFAEAWHNTGLVQNVVLVTMAFCLAASAVYAFNDICDAEADRLHPQKQHRPVANGSLSSREALIFAVGLWAGALGLAISVRLEAFALVGAYLLLNLFYSRFLRHIPFVDVLTIAAGFMLRVLAGTIGAGIPPSGWLLATSLALTLFLGFAKRRAEFYAASGRATRRSLFLYSPQVLNVLTLTTAFAAGILYTAFTLDSRSIQWHAASNMWLTALPAVGALGRYVLLVFRGRGENPARDFISDPWILLLAILWLVLTIVSITGGMR